MNSLPTQESGATRHVSRGVFVIRSRFAGSFAIPSAFTLLELLVVISIIGLLAGLAVPIVNKLKPNVVAGATRQLLDDVGRARQLAISQRTTVYMVFLPTNFWNDQAFGSLDLATQAKANKLRDKQMIAYNFVSLRSLGDQPGQPTARYLGSWKTLPEGMFIAPEKFLPRVPPNNPVPVLNIFTNALDGTRTLAMPVLGFNVTNTIPFPSEDTPPAPGKPYVTLPYIAFNYVGQLNTFTNEFIPLSKGSVIFQRDPATGAGTGTLAIRETPAGNTTNAFNVVSIDWLTGRAHLERQQVQ